MTSGLQSTRGALALRFIETRERTEMLAAPLSAEDQMLQSMDDCSPTRWHRAHTTWFFETFLLLPRGVPAYCAAWAPLFNSYYEQVGPRHPRARRGVLSRPSVSEVAEYRRVVEERVLSLLEHATESELVKISSILTLGFAHEEQHQELLMTDILHAFSENPLKPAYQPQTLARMPLASSAPELLTYIPVEGGLVDVGAAAEEGRFVFDNETPVHRVWLEPFALSNRLVTVAEVRGFVRDGGYRRASLWLSEGFAWTQANAVDSPIYMRVEGDDCLVFDLSGERVPCDAEPAVHLNYYEADAIARFLGARLPTEFELEHAGRAAPVAGGFLSDFLCPNIASGSGLQQLWGEAWAWTRSSYEAYPGFATSEDALGEYNGKFMVNQRVLRGGSYLTPPGHVRRTYRNFWPAHTRFQASGVRLARGYP